MAHVGRGGSATGSWVMICYSVLSTRARPEFGLNGVRSPWEVTSLTMTGRRLGKAEAMCVADSSLLPLQVGKLPRLPELPAGKH